MYLHSCMFSQSRLRLLLKKGAPLLYRRNFTGMTERVHKSNSYVSINVAQVKTQPRLVNVFKRSFSKKEARSDRKSEYYRLLALAKPERWKLAGAVCLLLVSSTVSMAVPFSLGKVLDIIYMHRSPFPEPPGDTSISPLNKLISTEPSHSHAQMNLSLNKENSTEEAKRAGPAGSAREDLNKVCGILVCIFVIGALCNYGRVYIMSTAGYRMTQRLRLSVFSSVLKQEQGFFDSRSTGELINRISADTQIVGSALSTNISDGLRSTIMVCAGSGMMFYVSPQLALIGLGIVPPVAGIAVLYGRFVRKISKKVQDSLADATQVAEEKISNVRTVRTFGQENKEISAYNEKITNVLDLGYKESKARALFFGMTGFGGNVIIISVLYFGGIMVSTNAITVGSLSSFLLYAAYIGVSIGGLTGFYSELNKSIGAAARLWELSDREPAIPIKGGVVPVDSPLGHIQFNGIKFSYPSRPETVVVQNLNLEISPGTTVAVVGPSGSGKSTLAALLLRLYDPDSGDVLLDGYNVKDLDPNWLRKQIGTVSQEPVLFSTTIRDNILYGADNPESVKEEDFLRVAMEANVHEFVCKLPDGYETLVGERGVMLSGGQKQRVAIARALIKNPKILLLDEATSALDAQSEYLVREAMERVMQGRTVLTIAHRLSTIQNADVIAVLENGSIIEKGTYMELLSLEKGHFKELMKHQTFQEFSATASPSAQSLS